MFGVEPTLWPQLPGPQVLMTRPHVQHLSQSFIPYASSGNRDALPKTGLTPGPARPRPGPAQPSRFRFPLPLPPDSREASLHVLIMKIVQAGAELLDP